MQMWPTKRLSCFVFRRYEYNISEVYNTSNEARAISFARNPISIIYVFLAKDEWGLIQAIKKAGDDKVLGYMCSIIVIKTSTKGNENQTCLNSFKSKILKIFLISYFFFHFLLEKQHPSGLFV